MPTFAFQARDKTGERVSGTREAGDQRAALEALREEGFFVTKLAPSANVPSANVPSANGSAQKTPPQVVNANGATASHNSAPKSTPEFGRTFPSATPNGAANQTQSSQPNKTEPKPQSPTAPPVQPPIAMNPWLAANAKERSLFFRQMYSMLNAGTSLGHALNTMSEHASNPALRRASREMSEQTLRGRAFSECMKAYPALFDQLSVGMIAAGERGGFLDRMCARLAEYAERDYDLQQTIKRETSYPKLLVFASILIPSAIPLVTTYVLGGSKVEPAIRAWLGSVGPPFLIIGGLWMGWKIWNRTMPVAAHGGLLKRAMDWVKLKTPVVSKTTKSFAAAKFCRAMGALYASGMGVHHIIDVAAGACGNAEFAAKTRAMIPQIERGVGLTESLAATGYFPGVALQMMRTGEMSGSIDTQLDKVADFLEQDGEAAVKHAVKIFGILIFLAMAAYIGSIIINQYMTTINGILDEGTKMGEGN